MNIIDEMSDTAWTARDNAIILGTTKVGCAVLSESGGIYAGCNIGHKFRCDIHAEIGAISSLVSSGNKHIYRLLVVAERESFTPCGACMDWIMELSVPETEIGFQSAPYGDITWYAPHQLMPYYPK